MKEETLQSRPFKVTIKFKSDKTISNCSTNIDQLNNVTGESNAEPNPDPPGSPGQVKLSSAEIIENHTTEDENNPSSENSQNQLVLYDPVANSGEAENDPDPIGYQPPSSSRQHPFSNKTPRVVSPAVGAFTIQCADCFKWRLIPTKEKYEEIREHIIEQPFSCETAREWKPEISCDSPPDITQDGSRLWAIDKPNIAQPPPGWQRLLRIRGEGGSKFADVYYVAPSRKRLRSMVEVQRYLNEHPHYVDEGVSLSQFSFQTPRPLNDNYVKKRPAPPRTGMSGSLDPLQVHPIAWRSPDVETDLQLSTNYYEASGLNPEVQSAKKKKTSVKKRYNSDVVYNQNEVNPEQSSEL